MEPVDSRHLYHLNADTEGLPDGSNAFRINIDDLEFGPEIGKGAYGKIFKGEYFGTPVGIKEITLSPNNSQYKDLVKFIQREVAMLRFSHPNLVQFIGVAERGQNLYIVTEFVSGGDLAYYLFKNKNEDTDSFMSKKVNIGSSSTPDLDTSSEKLINMSWPLRIKIAYDVACAMAYLHSRHVIHRDLKSTNLLVCDSWKIKVCDFGFARTSYTGLSGRAKRTMTICGTNNWMAPEVILGEDYNETCDVFSYGIVLSEIITRLETTSLLRPCSLKYGLDVDVLLPLVPKDCPPPFLKLALDCTEYDPDNRPTFKEITERLKSLTKRLTVNSMLPPLRVLAPSPITSPLTSPQVSRRLARHEETPSPLSICDDSDIESDDETEDSLDEYNSNNSNHNTKKNQNNLKSNSTKKMGYIIKHTHSSDLELNSAITPISLSPRQHLISSPAPFSPSSSITSKSPSPSNLSPSLLNLNALSSTSSTSTTSNACCPKSPKPQSPLRHSALPSDFLPIPTPKLLDKNFVNEDSDDEDSDEDSCSDDDDVAKEIEQLSNNLHHHHIWTPVSISPSVSPNHKLITPTVHLSINNSNNLSPVRAVHS